MYNQNQFILNLEVEKVLRTRKDSDLETKRKAISVYGILISDDIFECLRCKDHLNIKCAELAHLANNGKKHRILKQSQAGYTKTIEGHNNKRWPKGTGSSAGGKTFLSCLKKLEWPIEEEYPMAYICANCHKIIADQKEARQLAKELRIDIDVPTSKI